MNVELNLLIPSVFADCPCFVNHTIDTIETGAGPGKAGNRSF